MKDKSFSFEDIQIDVSKDRLFIGNSMIQRVFDLSSGMPRTISLTDPENGIEYASSEKSRCDFYFAGYNLPEMTTDSKYSLMDIDIKQYPETMLEGRKVCVILHMTEDVQKLNYWREYVIYPKIPAIAAVSWIEAETSPRIYSHPRKGVEFNSDIASGCGKDRTPPLESCGDSFLPLGKLSAVSTVKFTGRTDYSNKQAVESEACGQKINGNILFISDDERQSRVWMLQEAPPSDERRDFETYDFKIQDDGSVLSCCWGIRPEDVKPGIKLRGYRHVIGLQGKSLPKTFYLKQYLKHRFPINEQEGFSVMVNPWGTRNFPERVSEAFLIDELKASQELSATHYQIDDGWQNGKSLARLSVDNCFITNEFWKINLDLLPNGFDNIIAAAEKYNVEPALWVAPSNNCEYRDYREFTEILWNLHKQYGFRMFKIDAMRIRTKTAEDNLEKILKELRERSGGKIYFNLDTTNGMRPGYLMFLEYGNIFVENRYGNFGSPYHPEITLRNFWKLARYVRAQSLQFEFIDPQTIDPEHYRQNGLNLPTEYDPEYWAAVTMFANPLIWLSPSLLTPELKTTYKRIIELHLKYRKEIFAGEIFPIGHKPNGQAITGFQSYNADTGNGFLIVYRELKAPSAGAFQLVLGTENKYRLTSLNDDSVDIIKPAGTGEIEVNLQKPGSFRFYKMSKI